MPTLFTAYVQSAGNGAKDDLGVDTFNGQIFSSITEQNCFSSDKVTIRQIMNRVIVVTASDINFTMPAYANGGNSVSISAPGLTTPANPQTGNLGSGIYSTLPNHQYGFKGGTSMAAPMVAGVANLVWSINPDFTGAQVKAIVLDSHDRDVWIRPNAVTPPDSRGYRLVNAERAVKEALRLSGIDVDKDDKPITGEFAGITGKVMEQGTNAPLSGVLVQATKAGSTSIMDSATTNASGGFGLIVEPNASYNFKFTKAGYSEQTLSNVSVGKGIALPNVVMVPSVVSPSKSTITGKIIEQGTNAPLSGVQVEAFKTGSPTLVASATTNANGQYSLTVDRNATYNLRFRKAGYDEQTLTNINVVDSTIALPNVAVAINAVPFTTTPMIATGSYHSVVLKSDGTVWTWGRNHRGQLGDGTTTNRTTPIQVQNLNNVTAITAGDYHTVALKSDGTVWEWGDSSSRTSPVQVQNLNNVTAIVAGNAHIIALKSDGTVWAWGNNSFDQLGDGTTTNRDAPTQVQNLSNVKSISTVTHHTIALKTDGTVWAWGWNYYGQLIDGTTTDRCTPVQIQNLSNVIAIAAGENHSVALRSNGTVWAWGSNWFYQLGDGTDTARTTPVQVQNLSNVTSVTAGARFSVALRSNGTVWAWGDNGGNGKLGDGTTFARSTPVQVQKLNSITAVSTARTHSLAIKSDGTVWAWGDNISYQLGDNTDAVRLAPIQVVGKNGVGYFNVK